MRRGVHGTGDHAVGHAQQHHHGAEVGDVGDLVVGELLRHALVGAAGRVFVGEALAPPAVDGVDDARRGDVGADVGSGCLYAFRISEQRELGDTPPQHRVGGTQHALLLAFGQDDVACLASGAIDQPVLEHQRGDDLAAGDVEQVE